MKTKSPLTWIHGIFAVCLSWLLCRMGIRALAKPVFLGEASGIINFLLAPMAWGPRWPWAQAGASTGPSLLLLFLPVRSKASPGSTRCTSPSSRLGWCLSFPPQSCSSQGQATIPQPWDDPATHSITHWHHLLPSLSLTWEAQTQSKMANKYIKAFLWSLCRSANAREEPLFQGNAWFWRWGYPLSINSPFPLL